MARYFKCREPGRRLLGKRGLDWVVDLELEADGREASSRAPKARALSIAKRASVEYWFLKNSSMRALIKKIPVPSQSLSFLNA